MYIVLNPTKEIILTLCFTLSPPLFFDQVLQTLTDGIVPPPELLFTIKKLYDSKLKVLKIWFSKVQL